MLPTSDNLSPLLRRMTLLEVGRLTSGRPEDTLASLGPMRRQSILSPSSSRMLGSLASLSSCPIGLTAALGGVHAASTTTGGNLISPLSLGSTFVGSLFSVLLSLGGAAIGSLFSSTAGLSFFGSPCARALGATPLGRMGGDGDGVGSLRICHTAKTSKHAATAPPTITIHGLPRF